MQKIKGKEKILKEARRGKNTLPVEKQDRNFIRISSETMQAGLKIKTPYHPAVPTSGYLSKVKTLIQKDNPRVHCGIVCNGQNVEAT